jgi:hypothetical protein
MRQPCLFGLGAVWFMPKSATPNHGRAKIIDLLALDLPARGHKIEGTTKNLAWLRFVGFNPNEWPMILVNTKILV